MSIKVIAFDLFGTVFDLAGVPRQEIQDYAKHIAKPEWSPLSFPASWEGLRPFSDSKRGIEELRENFIVVTCSNAPLGLQIKLCKNADIHFDGHIPLELNKVFKTNLKAYMTICEVLGVQPNEVMMVTANEKFGDIEASAKLGMIPVLIRGCSIIQTIPELASCV